MKTVRCLLGMLVLGCLFVSQVQAGPIAVSSTGAGLAAGAIDPNYSMVAGPLGAGGLYAVQPPTPGFPLWVANQGTSVQWIAPSADLGVPPGGDYTIRTTFDLTGLDPLTASLTGEWASDNCSQILLNGVVMTQITPPGCLASMHPFSITSGFLPGINTLDFVVNNAGAGTTGLIVSFGVPEPATLTLLGCGLAGLLLLRRRYSKA